MRVEYSLSEEFLVKLLSLVFVDPYGIRVVRALDPALLPNETAITVYAAVKAVVQSTGEIPQRYVVEQTLFQRYQTGAFKGEVFKSAFDMIGNACTVEPMSREVARSVLRESLLHAGIGLALDGALNCYRKREYDEIKDLVDKAYSKPRLLDLGSPGRRASTSLDARIAEVASGTASIQRIPFGLAKMDIRLKGGLGRGELGCVLAAQKVGKSMALCWISQTAVLLGYKVVYITLELSEREVQARIEAGITGLETDAIGRGGIEVAKTLREKLVKVFEGTGGDYVVKQFPAKAASVKDIEAYLRDVAQLWAFQPDVLIVDYADELSMPGKAERYQAVGDLYSELRALGSPADSSYGTTGGFNCAVWTASQIKVSAIDHEYIRMWDAAESYLKAAKIDLMIAICSDEQEAASDLLRLYVAACRYASAGRGVHDEYGPFTRDYKHGRLLDVSDKARFDVSVAIRRRAEFDFGFGNGKGGVSVCDGIPPNPTVLPVSVFDGGLLD